MQSENNTMSGEGSPTARFALAALAKSLNLSEAVLKFALEVAFDILPNVRQPGHALNIALARFGYRFDNPSFFAALKPFHHTFAPALGGSDKLPSSITVPWMASNPYRALKGGFGPYGDDAPPENLFQDHEDTFMAPSRQQYQEYAELAEKALSYQDSGHGFDYH